MKTLAYIQKLNQDVRGLKSDLHQMKKFLFTPTEDPEGPYRGSFIKKMLVRNRNSEPVYRFTGKTSFLAHVRSKK